MYTITRNLSLSSILDDYQQSDNQKQTKKKSHHTLHRF